MNAKHNADGSPNVLYLQSALDAFLGEGEARTILPITDPFVVHHGALGPYATVSLPEGAAAAAVARQVAGLEAVERVHASTAAAATDAWPAAPTAAPVVV